MRILAPSTEGYPVNRASSFILMHQSMALEEMGHEVHLFNVQKPPLRLADYIEAYEIDLIFADIELLKIEDLCRVLHDYRRKEAIRVVAALYSLPPPPDEVWEIVDFCVTPWTGRSVESLALKWDVRYLPLGYNSRLHQRVAGTLHLGPVYAGNTAGSRMGEAEERLKTLREERIVLCIGPAYEQKYLDPYILGRVYASSRCVPNFHYCKEKDLDRMLNERFWQGARCGIPVNDFSPLMAEVWNEELLKAFCFADIQAWQERIRALWSETAVAGPDILERLDRSLVGHSYHDRMSQLLAWLE